MNITYPLHLVQLVSVESYGHHQVVVQIRNKKCILGRGLFFTNIKYAVFGNLIIIPNRGITIIIKKWCYQLCQR